jgi:hypothetical protein
MFFFSRYCTHKLIALQNVALAEATRRMQTLSLSRSPRVSVKDGISTGLVDVEDEYISSPVQSKP